MNWQQITTLEPQLETLRLKALEERSRSFTTWEMYKNRFKYVVGMYAQQPELYGEYDNVYQVIRKAFES